MRLDGPLRETPCENQIRVVSTEFQYITRPRRCDSSLRNIHVAAGLVSAEYPRRGRGGAATRLVDSPQIPPVYAAAEALAPGRSPGKVVKKMLFSCALLSTFGNWVTMFARRYLQVLRGVDESSSFRDCVASCNRDIWPVLRVDLKIWPLYDVLCFAVIAPDWRPVATTLMSCAWQAFMSAVSARTARREAE